MSEKELVRRSQARDWDAFELLPEGHRTTLARTAYQVYFTAAVYIVNRRDR